MPFYEEPLTDVSIFCPHASCNMGCMVHKAMGFSQTSVFDFRLHRDFDLRGSLNR